MIVVDASVAVKWIAAEPGYERALTLLDRTDLIAPYLLAVELANALRRKVEAGEVLNDQAVQGIQRVMERVELTVPDFALLSRAFAIGLELHHPIYDCLYLAVAEARSATFATFDDEFRDLATSAGYGSLFATLAAGPAL